MLFTKNIMERSMHLQTVSTRPLLWGGGGPGGRAVYAWTNVLPVLLNLVLQAKLMWEEKSDQISHQAFT